MTVGNNPTDRSKLGTKRHILTDNEGIPLSAVISSANTHDIKLVTDVVDNAVIKKQTSSSSSKSKKGKRVLQQHLCLDKGYNSAQEEQELIKRGYVLHIPHKKRNGKEEDEYEEINAISNHQKYLQEMGCRKDKFMA